MKIKCQTCGKEFKTNPSRQKEGKGKYCRKACIAKKREALHKGYPIVWRPDHPSADRGYVPKHRLVVEEKLGRFLRSDELVHHRDENPLNYDPANLVIVTKAEHGALHARNWVVFEGEILSEREACKRIGLNPGTVARRMIRFGISRQEAFDMSDQRGKWLGGKRR